MRKLAGISAVTVCLTISGTAAAGLEDKPEYGGKIDDKKSRYIGFDVTGSGDERRIKNIFVANVRFKDCDDPMNNGEQSGSLEGSANVKPNGNFSKTADYDFSETRGGDGNATGLKYKLEGRLEGKKADGTLRIQVKGNGCDSGKVEWKAKKPSPDPPVGPL